MPTSAKVNHHSSAPWIYREGVLYDALGDWIADLVSGRPVGEGRDANGHLMAAAPVLQRRVDELESMRQRIAGPVGAGPDGDVDEVVDALSQLLDELDAPKGATIEIRLTLLAAARKRPGSLDLDAIEARVAAVLDDHPIPWRYDDDLAGLVDADDRPVADPYDGEVMMDDDGASPADRMIEHAPEDLGRLCALQRRLAHLLDGASVPAHPDIDHRLELLIEHSLEALSAALSSVQAERLKQIGRGYDASHDDGHTKGQLAAAAAYIAIPPGAILNGLGLRGAFEVPAWAVELDDELGDVGDRRQQLVVAGALIVSEIERLDRAAAPCIAIPPGASGGGAL